MECDTTNRHKYIYLNLVLVKKTKGLANNKLNQHSCIVQVSDNKAGL